MNKTVNEQTTNLDDFVLKYITYGKQKSFNNTHDNPDLLEEYKKKLIEVDKYTDGLGSYIVKLVYEFWEEYRTEKYKNFFGDDWLKHWKMDYDARDLVYVEEDGSIEFKFLGEHHSCLCGESGRFIINRMVTEIRDCLLLVCVQLGSTLGKDSYAYKHFWSEHEKFLTYEDNYDYKLKGCKDILYGYGYVPKYCNPFRPKK